MPFCEFHRTIGNVLEIVIVGRGIGRFVGNEMSKFMRWNTGRRRGRKVRRGRITGRRRISWRGRIIGRIVRSGSITGRRSRSELGRGHEGKKKDGNFLNGGRGVKKWSGGEN
jgi:hypothetical protein